MLDDTLGNIKLADFSIAEQLKNFKSTQVTFGVRTIKWMTPEIVKRERYGLKVDIWSVECTVVEMLTGYPQWNKLNDTPTTINNVFNGEYPIYV